MREEIKNLWEQAKKDIEMAEKNFLIKGYYITAFLCQQAVEKALKALFMIVNKKSSGPTHSLIYLAEKTKVPKSFYRILQDLSPEFITTRYPDVSGTVPYKIYSEEKVQNYLIKSKEIMKWLERKIK